MSYADLADSELVLMLKGKNKQAFDAVYMRYHEVLFVYADTILKDADAAADIVQDVFIKLWERSVMIPDYVNLKGYLYSAVRNKVINYIRDNKTRLMHNYAIVCEKEDTVENSAFWNAEEQYEKERVQKAIGSLPPQQRKVVEYRFSGYSNKEIAKRMKLSLNTVNVHYRLCLKALKNFLNKGENWK